MPDALYYRQQAERFDRVADQCAVPDLVPYYRKLAFDCLAEAVRAEAAEARRRSSNSHRSRSRRTRRVAAK